MIRQGFARREVAALRTAGSSRPVKFTRRLEPAVRRLLDC
jgi:hypothetical protein